MAGQHWTQWVIFAASVLWLLDFAFDLRLRRHAKALDATYGAGLREMKAQLDALNQRRDTSPKPPAVRGIAG